MTDKFIPFNPETAKNGNIVYGCYSKAEFVYIGPTPINGHSSFVIVYDVANELYKAMPFDNLRIKAPKKTVWVNVYKDGTAVWRPSKKETLLFVDKDKLVDTYPLEIDDVA